MILGPSRKLINNAVTAAAAALNVTYCKILISKISYKKIIQWYSINMPLSGYGKLILGESNFGISANLGFLESWCESR